MIKNKNEITLLIGNGLCRAFQDDHECAEFELSKIIIKILKEENSLNKEKELIKKIFPDKFSLECEDGIGKLNEIIEALRILQEIDFPYLKKEIAITEVVNAYYTLVNKALIQIFLSSEVILDDFKKWFKEKLHEFLSQENVNIATLNYDHLLHTTIFQTEDFKKQYTDGFLSKSNVSTFSRSCFEKLTHVESTDKRKGFFHLHGSYLIRECENNKLKKLRRSELSDKYFTQNYGRSAVLLTSQTKKMPVIHTDFSGLLRTYHLYFLNCLRHSSQLIFLGYSGNDQYLNDEISYAAQSNKELEIFIIVWDRDCYKQEEKKNFWHTQLKSKERKFKRRIKFKFLEDIREYEFLHS